MRRQDDQSALGNLLLGVDEDRAAGLEIALRRARCGRSRGGRRPAARASRGASRRCRLRGRHRRRSCAAPRSEPACSCRTRRRDGGRCPLERRKSTTRRPRRPHSPARLGDESADDRSPGDAAVGSRGPRQPPDRTGGRVGYGPDRSLRACRWQPAHRSPCRQRPRPFGARKLGPLCRLVDHPACAAEHGRCRALRTGRASPSQSTEPSSPTTRVAVSDTCPPEARARARRRARSSRASRRERAASARGRPGRPPGAASSGRPLFDRERAGERDRLGIRQRSVHARLRTVSLRLAVVASVAEGSNPQWIPQCSHRGSFPGP